MMMINITLWNHHRNHHFFKKNYNGKNKSASVTFFLTVHTFFSDFDFHPSNQKPWLTFNSKTELYPNFITITFFASELLLQNRLIRKEKKRKGVIQEHDSHEFYGFFFVYLIFFPLFNTHTQVIHFFLLLTVPVDYNTP